MEASISAFGNGLLGAEKKQGAIGRLSLDSKEVIFILSHMRSGSTLLTHILNSNPEICGYGESRIRYRSECDVSRLALRLRDFFGNDFDTSRFLIDKLLHNEMLVDDGLLCASHIRCAFLLRPASQAIQSMVRIYAELQWPMTPSQAIQYYTTRLEALIRYAQTARAKSRCFLLTYHQLIHQTEIVFGALKDWLGLEEPLSEDYVQHEATGIAGIGDPSDMIKMGQIVRCSKSVSYQCMSFPEAESIYIRTLTQLQELCLSIV